MNLLIADFQMALSYARRKNSRIVLIYHTSYGFPRLVYLGRSTRKFPFFSDDYLSLLEIGSGAIKLIMELKIRFPLMYVIGTNFISSDVKLSVNNKFVLLTGSEEKYWATGKLFNLTVKCELKTRSLTIQK